MAPSEAQLLTIFSKFDTDGSGKIDMAELTWALRSGGKKVSQEELIKVVELVDKDNDGEIYVCKICKTLVSKNYVSCVLV